MYIRMYVVSILTTLNLVKMKALPFRKQFTVCTHLSGHTETWTCPFLSNVWVIEQGLNNAFVRPFSSLSFSLPLVPLPLATLHLLQSSFIKYLIWYF